MKKMLVVLFSLIVTLATFAQSAGFVSKYFVDDFGDSKSEMYLQSVISGVFSNSAVTNAELLAGVMLAKDEAGITLFEYGTHRVKSDSEYTVKIKTADGTVYLAPYAQGFAEIGRIVFVFPRIVGLDTLKIFNGKTLTKFYVYETDSPKTNYNFSCVLPTLEYIKSQLGNELAWMYDPKVQTY